MSDPELRRRRDTTGPFAVNLQHAMARARCDASELADLVGDTSRRINRLRVGETEPHYAEVPAIARALRVPPEHLCWMPAAEFGRRYALVIT